MQDATLERLEELERELCHACALKVRDLGSGRDLALRVLEDDPRREVVAEAGAGHGVEGVRLRSVRVLEPGRVARVEHRGLEPRYCGAR